MAKNEESFVEGDAEKALDKPEPKAIRPSRETPVTKRGVDIANVEDAVRVATWAYESHLLPADIQSPQQAFVIMMKGKELGLPPFTAWTRIYLTKARRLAIDTKGALAVVQSSPVYKSYREWIEFEDTDDMRGVAEARRKGQEPIIKTFSIADAKRAGLIGSERKPTYDAYLKDMLLARARGRALDLAFADVLGGIPLEGVAEDADRMEDVRRGRHPEVQVIPGETPRGPSGADPILSRLLAKGQPPPKFRTKEPPDPAVHQPRAERKEEPPESDSGQPQLPF